MWLIISLVTAVAFGPEPFSSRRHFATEAECEAYITADAMELISELKRDGVQGPYSIKSRCALDTRGDPA